MSAGGRNARWLVDGMNVIGARPDGWWRDRPAAMRRLAERLGRYAERSGDEVTVVYDGRPFELGLERPPGVVFARRRGRDAADDRIAELVADDPEPATLRVVTSDRELAARARARGAEPVSAGRFRRLVDDALGVS